MNGNSFNKEKTLVVKGVAITMMMWHHCFLNGRYSGYSIIFWPFVEGHITSIASFSKLCVALFAFVSGFGLCHSFRSTDPQHTNMWIYERIVRTLKGFWFVVILMWLLSMIIDQRPIHLYGFDQSLYLGIWNSAVDLLGLQNLFGSVSLSEDWWYMSAAVIYVIFTPFLIAGTSHFGGAAMLGLLFTLPRIAGTYPGVVHFLSFLPSFYMGILFSYYRLFEKWDMCTHKSSTTHSVVICLEIILVFLYYKFYGIAYEWQFWDVKWGLFLPIMVIFIKDVITMIPLLCKVLCYLGKHSSNIYWVHTFIRLYYLKDFIYGLKHFAIIVFTLLITSLACSIIIEHIKKLLNYDVLISKLFNLR